MGMYDTITLGNVELPYKNDKMKERIRNLDTFQTHGYNDMLDEFIIDPKIGLFYEASLKSINGGHCLFSPIDEKASEKFFELAKETGEVIPYTGGFGFGGCDMFGTCDIIGFVAHYKDGKLTKIVNNEDKSEIICN